MSFLYIYVDLINPTHPPDVELFNEQIRKVMDKKSTRERAFKVQLKNRIAAVEFDVCLNISVAVE